MVKARKAKNDTIPSALKSRWILVSIALALSVIAMMAPYALPAKKQELPLSNMSHYSLYGDETLSPVSAKYIDQRQWTCNVIVASDETSCGIAVDWFYPKEAINFSDYHTVRLGLTYTGPTSRVAIYLVNAADTNVDNGNGIPPKMNVVYIMGEEVDGELDIGLEEFAVAEWWVEENNVPRSDVYTEFDEITTLEIGFGNEIRPGEHFYEFDSAALIGRWVQPTHVHLLVLSAWVAVALFNLFYRMTSLKLQARNYRETLGSVREEKDKYQRLSVTDKLTGVLNRTGFEAEMKNIIAQNSSLSGYAFFVFDIDRYKGINDREGHSVGDRLLQEFTSVVSSHLNKSDIFARWGGDEFVLLREGIDIDIQLAFVNGLLREISEHRFFGSKALTVTSSAGVTAICRDESFDEAFRRADEALLEAKQNGRNCCVVAEAPDNLVRQTGEQV